MSGSIVIENITVRCICEPEQSPGSEVEFGPILPGVNETPSVTHGIWIVSRRADRTVFYAVGCPPLGSNTGNA